MKRFVVACVTLLACAQMSARAADIPARYPAPYRAPVYGTIYNWTGFYIGINGGGWGRSQWDGIDKFNVSGGLIGGTIGYNWQINQLVIGAEGDIDWSGIKGTTNVLCPPVARAATRGSRPRASGSATRSIASCRISPPAWHSATFAPAFPDFPAAASPMPDGPWAAVSSSASSRM